MSDQPAEPDDAPPSTDESGLRRVEEQLLALDRRIARLADELGIELSTPSGEQAVWRSGGDGLAWSPSANERHAHLHDELKAMLMLRDQLVVHSCAAIGSPQTLRAVAETELRLQREGFEPGADGTDLDELGQELGRNVSPLRPAAPDDRG